MSARSGAFAVRRGEIKERADVHYATNIRALRVRYSAPRYPLQPLGHLTTLVQYGTSARAHTEPDGTPVLRIPNLQADGWDLSDLKYLALEPGELERYRLQSGDILFNRTNGSRELVGKCEVFNFPGDWVFASYLIRLRLDTGRALPAFVTAFLNTYWGRKQVEHVSRQIVMSNINAQEVRRLQIPLPDDLEVQRKLVDTLTRAQEKTRELRARAGRLLDAIDELLVQRLGLVPGPAREPDKPFAVRLSAVRGRRLDPPSLAPFQVQQNPLAIPLRLLSAIAAIDARVGSKTLRDEDKVPYVGLPECDLNSVREVSSRFYRQVKGRSIAEVGDILFARIEPSVFNKKYVFVQGLEGHESVFLSTEFYCVRANGDDTDQQFLYAMFHSTFVYNQVRGKTTGSSGRRRLDRDLFESLLIPWPDRDARHGIALEVTRRRAEAKQLQNQASRTADLAKVAFENALLGPSQEAR